jgi:hypothetical protein
VIAFHDIGAVNNNVNKYFNNTEGRSGGNSGRYYGML